MTVKITIDSKECEIEPGKTVLDAATKHGIHIPTLCYNQLFGEHRSGACRMCLVEITGGGRPGLLSACTLPATDGLKVSTNSEAVFQARRTVVELLLSEHTQDCRNCPISGNCNFASLCREYDINGVPVCAECPNQKEGCLLSRDVLCLGPITYANCEAYCTRRGYRCEGCHSVLAHEDVLKFGLLAYEKAGFTPDEILEGAKVYSYDGLERLKTVMKNMGMLSEEVD
jgi:predicted molibdopterin-dependent oxidoreductase YjgC